MEKGGVLKKTMLPIYFFLGSTLLLVPINFYIYNSLEKIHKYTQFILTLTLSLLTVFVIKGYIKVKEKDEESAEKSSQTSEAVEKRS